MKNNVLLPIASLFSILLLTLHLAGDVVRGERIGPGGFVSILLIVVVWLYGTLMLAGRRWGHVITLLGSLVGLSIPFFHMMGPGGVLSGDFYFVWTLLALGVTALFSFILSVRGLWSLKGPSRPSNTPPSRPS